MTVSGIHCTRYASWRYFLFLLMITRADADDSIRNTDSYFRVQRIKRSAHTESNDLDRSICTISWVYVGSDVRICILDGWLALPLYLLEGPILMALVDLNSLIANDLATLAFFFFSFLQHRRLVGVVSKVRAFHCIEDLHFCMIVFCSTTLYSRHPLDMNSLVG